MGFEELPDDVIIRILLGMTIEDLLVTRAASARICSLFEKSLPERFSKLPTSEVRRCIVTRFCQWRGRWPRCVLASLLKTPGLDLNAIDVVSGETPLVVAIRWKRLATAWQILDAGAALDPGHPGCLTPLDWAARGVNCTAVETLVARRADVGAQGCRGFTPLHWAVYERWSMCQERVLRVVECLLRNGAAVDVRNDDGLTPLGVARLPGYPHERVRARLREAAGCSRGLPS